MTPYQRLKKYNTKGNLWVYILAVLKDGPEYAWLLPDIIEKRFNFRPGKITPYRVLYDLEEEELVHSKLEDRKRMYAITAKGEKELKKVKSFYNEIINNL